MLPPPPKSHEADAGGLGLEALSDCAEPSKAIIPMAKHPAPRNATLLFMVPSSEAYANIESNLTFSRNSNCHPLKTHATKFCFAASRPLRCRASAPNLESSGVLDEYLVCFHGAPQ